MIPQILQQLNGGLRIPPQIRQMIGMLKSSGNPQAMLMQLAQTNPNMKQVMEIVQQYGGDAEKAFYAVAQQKGIDPQQILNLLK